MASSSVVWELVKDHNAFLVKRGNFRDGVKFSREKGNLANISSPKYSGLSNKKVVDISPSKDRVGVVISIKSKKSRSPSKTWNSSSLRQGFRRNANIIAERVQRYNPELKVAALARLSALNRASRTQVISKKRKAEAQVKV